MLTRRGFFGGILAVSGARIAAIFCRSSVPIEKAWVDAKYLAGDACWHDAAEWRGLPSKSVHGREGILKQDVDAVCKLLRERARKPPAEAWWDGLTRPDGTGLMS